MTTRTKGFFDQDHQKKPRPGYWNRRPYDHPSAIDGPAVNPPKSPIPATSEAKSKLQAFHFVPPDSENGLDHTRPSSGPGASHGARDVALSAHSSADSKTPSLPHANTFPCTPGTRLPLEDLIGNCDEVQQKEPEHNSPEEHIGWVPGSSSNTLTPNSRKRKRAKSSSPSCPNTSSQQERPPPFLGESAVPSTAKKASAADPATELWQRYANGRHNGQGLNIPEIVSTIFQESPRQVETPIKSGPLRRWASTGNDWPSTKNKRACPTTRQAVNVWQDQSIPEVGAKSRVATMVQKIQETLATQQLEKSKVEQVSNTVDLPSSSSPLPEVCSQKNSEPGLRSPLQNRPTNVKNSLQAVQSRNRVPDHKSFAQRQQFRPTASGGIRTDAAKLVGDPLNPSSAGSLHLQSKAPLPAYKRPSITRAPSQPKVQQAVALPSVPTGPKDTDEFGDDAFDLTADDLDELELLSQPPAGNTEHYAVPRQPEAPPQRAVSLAYHNVATKGPIETIIVDDDDDDDEFKCDDIDEDTLAQAEISATQAPRSTFHRRSPRKTQRVLKSQSSGADTLSPVLQRYVVNQVVDGEFTNDRGRRCPERVVSTEDWHTSRSFAITLRDSWINTPLSKGNVIHVASLNRYRTAETIDKPPTPGQIIIDDSEGSAFIVLHPDHMLSATTVADSFDCIRKAVLQDRIRATGETSKAMIYGKMLHEIFQQALSANQWDNDNLTLLVGKTVQMHVEGLWELGMTDTNLAVEEIRGKMGEVAAWARAFVRDEPDDASLVDDRQGGKIPMSISKLIAIEEHIWSPRFGLKGNVDATVQTTVSGDSIQGSKKLIVPFEVKTGRTTQSPAHQAQTALYTLLLSDRYDVAVESGILYYLESSTVSRIAPPVVDVRQMVQQRNRLASYIFRSRHPPRPSDPAVDEVQTDGPAPQLSQAFPESGLPVLLKNPHKCGRCYAQQSCFTYHALIENGSAESAGMLDDKSKNHSQVWKEAVNHILSCKSVSEPSTLKRWFTKWDKLLTFEERDQARFRKELWTVSSVQREALGRCFGNMVVSRDLTDISTAVTQQVVDGIEGSGGKINRYAYAFTRATSTPGRNFTEGSQLTAGEPIVISSEHGQWALANGYIVATTKHEVTVAVDRKLSDARRRMPGFDENWNQVFRGTAMTGAAHPETASMEQILYRIDKDEFSNGLALVRNNLVTLMSSHPIHTKLREQIVFGAEPAFNTESPTSPCQPTQLGSMNEDQEAAVAKVLNAQDYALILGMPGTGKTTTIAHIIRALLARDQSILLTSFTHTAVDNILLKIQDIAPPGSILRLGVPTKINTKVQQFCKLAATPRTSVQEVEDAYMGTRIVATTCMGTNHPIFKRRSFDVCIVDEASQITVPTILGPLLHARKFVLVGDHFQLPPLVQNRTALEGGMDISLFRQLSEEHENAVAPLGRQYRMCKEIMMLSNELIYGGQLRCGSVEVGERTLGIRDSSALETLHRSNRCQDCWVDRLTTPSAKVVFANTDSLGAAAQETLTASGKNITNPLEALVCTHLVLSFLAMGVPARDIGVITLYRSQLSLLRQSFKTAGICSDVEIDSADRFQGRDKECVVVSMVRSNEAGVVGELLKDWRRVNVAITRARSKLVMVGSRRTLVNNDLLSNLLAIADREQWTMDLPRAWEKGHGFDIPPTQMTQPTIYEASPERRPIVKPSSQSPAKKPSLVPKSPRQVNQREVRTPLADLGGMTNISVRDSLHKQKMKKNGSPRRILGGGKGSRMAEKLRLVREEIAREISFAENASFGNDEMED